MPAFFVTGTDTEVGKTLVSTALLRAAAARGVETLGLKPIAAGCEQTPDGLRNEDALAHMAASTIRLPYEAVNPIALAPAIAPHIAAADVGLTVTSKDLVSHCMKLIQPKPFTLIEGAGGWLVPLNDRESFADFALALGLPVVLVVSMRLGCINHALLTAQAIASRGLQLAGWIANAAATAMDRKRENVASLRARINAPCLGEVPWCDSMTAARYLNIEPLLRSEAEA